MHKLNLNRLRLIIVGICLAQLGFADGTLAIQAPTWREQQNELDRQFESDLQPILQWCEDNGLEQQAQQTREMVFHRDLRRQYVFLPSELSMPKAGEDLQGQWQEKVNTARRDQAKRILELAKQAVEAGAGGVAFQLLNEAIHYDRDEESIRKTLGHRKTDDGWRVASDSIRVRKQKRKHADFNWPSGRHIVVLTPHFEIESNASEARTKYLAEKLERWQAVWRQLFVEYWSSTAAVKRWISGDSKFTSSRKRFRVVFFASREEYVQQLSRTVRGIGKSTGYYSNTERTSYFYDGDEQVQGTWRHELTHQLFRESGRTNKNPLEKQFIWVDEGVATYFESLTDYGDYVTLGGFDARRIQYARIRRLLERFHIPIKQLSAMGRNSLQQHPDIERVYSEAAGLTDMLFNINNGAHEKGLVEFMRLIHKGRVKPTTFESVTGQTYQQWDAQYPEFLKVDSKMVEMSLSQPESRTELSLPDAGLTSEAFDRIAQCVNLTFLDLSKNAITTDNFVQLKTCQKIERLILTSSSFEEGPIRGFELFPLLSDLDLSGSSIQDDQLASFKDLTNLRSLRLAVTSISDQGLTHLANVRGLVSLDLTRARVTDQGVAKLQQRLPNLRIVR